MMRENSGLSGEPYPLEQIVILVSVRLESETEVEQPYQPAVTIEKGVDRFKLHVGKGSLQEYRDPRLVQEALEI